MKSKLLILSLAFFCLALAQVDIHQKSKDGYIRVPMNESVGTSEIYTSMYQLEKFFEEEKSYVEDIKLMIDKKLVNQGAVTGISLKVVTLFNTIFYGFVRKGYKWKIEIPLCKKV